LAHLGEHGDGLNADGDKGNYKVNTDKEKEDS